MNWLKTFEELNPGTYRRAASKLQNWNKSNRADQLSDWADEKEYGFYNLHIGESRGRNDSIIVKNSTFTLPSLVGVYYGYSSGNSIPSNLINKKQNEIESLANRMVNDWVDGDVSCLSIMFEFGFKPTKETMKKDNRFKNLSYSNNSLIKWKDANRYTGSILPTFRINLLLTDETYGKESYYEEWKYETEREGKEWTEPSVYQYYEDTSYDFITLSRPFTDTSFGVFSDRKSAIKFKNYFLSIMNGETYGERIDIKSVIMEVLSIVGGESVDIERIMGKLRNIRIHGLYDDEIEKVSFPNVSERWFSFKTSELHPWGKRIN